ncbi:helix-turn-helix domain-containing protein [Listeria booriae]|uniref:HTH domain-containing protein n=1 Tax=Listeria booriae TaxID=1552123 RepID=A0A7X0XZZ3_9LIST|nr:helix-turn-helix domain-containing protein [Listeria booriae]MBC1794195.1 HTH domain-containing protein [Listeria booriae]MBC1813608.1 HTH domain-containing protein [Listeria booriae]MDT0111249.1 helix-turn-helix domain-containing protein [Listeria booriae]
MDLQNKVEDLFLRTEDRRILELTEYLNQTGNWVTAKDVATKLECSTQTVYAYTEKLDAFITQNNWPLTLEITKSKGIRLIADTNFYIGTVRYHLITSSIVFKFFDACFHEDYFRSLTAFAEENFISIPSLNTYLSDFQNQIEPYLVQIDRVNFRLIGEEHHIRYFASTLYWHCFAGIEWPFRNIPREQMLPYAERFKVAYHLDFNNIIREKLLYRIAACKTRTIHQHFVPDNPYINELVRGHPYYRNVIAIHRDFYADLGTEHTNLESAFLFTIFQTFAFFGEETDYLQDTIHFHQQRNTHSWQKTKEFLDAFSKVYPMEAHLVHTSRVLGYLLFIQTRLFLFSNTQPDYYYEDFVELQQKYPSFSNSISAIIDTLYASADESNSREKKLVFLQKTTRLLISLIPVIKYEPVIYVLIASGDSSVFVDYAMSELRKHFDFNFHFLYNMEAYLKCDLVIADSYFPDFQDPGKLIYWSPSDHNSNWHALNKKLMDIRDEKLNGN